jgi:hypothetical protein
VSDPRERSGSQRGDDWLRRDALGRERPWALEEQLLAPERERKLVAVAAKILQERRELGRLQGEIRERVTRLGELEQELHDLVGHKTTVESAAEAFSAARERETPHVTVELRTPGSSAERDYWLCRCHGFRVESGEHTVGTVEGVRYGSSATRPDVIEVRAGRFGRRSLLIAVEDVEDIVEEEGALLLRPSAVEQVDLAHALLARIRGRFGQSLAT